MGVQCILTIPKDGKTPTPPSTNLTQAERQRLLSPNQGSVYLVESPRGSNEADISPTTLNEAVRSQFLGCSSSECHNGNIVQPTPWCADTGSTISKMLAKQLCEARLEYPKCSRRFFVPNGKQEELITVQAVTQIILEGNEGCSFVSPESARKIAEETCRCARQFFAILAYMKKGPDIRSILREGLSDGDLPLKRKEGSAFVLERKNGEPVDAFKKWEDRYLEKFDRIQWWMTAPVFEQREKLYELDENTVLPFIDDGHWEQKQGGYSDVFRVCIHPAHHRFWELSESEVQESHLFSMAIVTDEYGIGKRALRGN